jgi:hypothetical protein
MANFTGIQLPDFSAADLTDSKTVRQILEMLYQLNEQLRYTLYNLGKENLGDELRQQVDNNDAVNSLTSRVEDAENGLSSLRRQTAEGFEQTVRKDNIISSINQTAELIKIAASVIALEGYVSINGTFSVDEAGYMRSTGGNIAGWYIMPNMLLGGPTSEINSGKIVGSQLYGTEIYGSDGIYMGYSGSGIILGQPYIDPYGVHTATVDAGSVNDSLTLGSGIARIVLGGDLGYPVRAYGAFYAPSISSPTITNIENRLTALENRVSVLEGA